MNVNYDDPADLLPFEKELEPHDPSVEVLPKSFRELTRFFYLKHQHDKNN